MVKRATLLNLIIGVFSTLWAVNGNSNNVDLFKYTVINNQELSVKLANASIEGKIVIPDSAEVNGRIYPITRIVVG